LDPTKFAFGSGAFRFMGLPFFRGYIISFYCYCC